MKKFILIILLSIMSVFGFSQNTPVGVFNNFEDGNWNYYSDLCWGIGPNSSYFGTKVTGNGFNGSSVCETDNLGHTSICRLESPWINIQQGAVITYTHEIPAFDGVRQLSVYALSYPSMTPTLLKVYSYSNSNPISDGLNFSPSSGIYKIQWLWNGSGGNSRGQIDNITINGTDVSDPNNNCQVSNPYPVGGGETFENGDWTYYHNLCWGISPTDPFYRTQIIANGFNTTHVVQTADLGAGTYKCILESPYFNFNGTNHVKFHTALTNFSISKNLYVCLVNPSGIESGGHFIAYPNGGILQEDFDYSSVLGNYKVRLIFYATPGGSPTYAQVDYFEVVGGTNVSDPSNNCLPYTPPPADSIINYYPATDMSTLAFEDLWPYYGDYDMNDLVIGYKFKVVSTSQSKVADVYCTFTVRATGAGLHNGFGFQFANVLPSNIVSVEGVDQQNGYTISSNGTEGGQTSATFIVYDDQYKFMSQWNTIKGGPTCPEKTFNVHIKFVANTVVIQQLAIQNWNPFIVIGGVRGHELHLPNYYPTSKVDPSIWGTGDDATNPSQNKWYKSKTNLPWAIDIYGHFYYPSEISDISNAYLHFQDWVLSNGTQYQDWWSNTSSGYRDNNLIY